MSPARKTGISLRLAAAVLILLFEMIAHPAFGAAVLAVSLIAFLALCVFKIIDAILWGR